MSKKTKNASDLVRHSEVKAGSNRSFGIVFTVLFTVIALWPLLNEESVRLWAAVTALFILLISLFIPAVLAPLNQIWFKFGLLLHLIVNPVIMAVMFFGIYTPVAFILKIMRVDLLRLRSDKKVTSYWVVRNPPGPEPESMRDQF